MYEGNIAKIIKIKTNERRVVFEKSIFNQELEKIEKEIKNYSNAIKDLDAIYSKPKYKIEQKFLFCYFNFTKALLLYIKKIIGETPYVLSNEIRAIYSHLVDFGTADWHDQPNIEKAYGHLRRLALDTMKIICDEYDKFFLRYIHKYSKFNLKKVCSDFLRQFEIYHTEARKLYAIAQDTERLGTNSGGAEYQAYYDAVCKFIDLRQFVSKYHKGVKKKQCRSNIGMLASIILTIIFPIATSILCCIFKV